MSSKRDPSAELPDPQAAIAAAVAGGAARDAKPRTESRNALRKAGTRTGRIVASHAWERSLQEGSVTRTGARPSEDGPFLGDRRLGAESLSANPSEEDMNSSVIAAAARLSSTTRRLGASTSPGGGLPMTRAEPSPRRFQ